MAKLGLMGGALVAALVACAPVAGSPAAEEVGAAAAPVGVIVARRPLVAAGEAARGQARRAVLAAIGAPPPAAAWGADEYEFVVRTDDGRTFSVVQPAAGLVAGQRVRVLAGERLRLSPLGR
jgi:outer membrane lipoprotein SlyB